MKTNELITQEDLQAFKTDLLLEIKKLLDRNAPLQQARWLKSSEVRKLLQISPGTLQNLRVNGSLSYTRIGSLMYYKLEDIEKLLKGGTS
ncbi:helix-turn-helix domain-containing protein [Mucilaginibacter lacusdianchii]|uniref:helix-turn-helix domain-containing protein n=1 Tax=Mucilaginibacter lacusdianchii TaxID=2684211 RepID=UPI00131BD3F5|nr:helix-turn-helix domain-containing protein [Mucilaginibacter sp. JXJ CY 39]